MKLPTKDKPKEADLRKYKYILYGTPGAGKSTLASKFPNAIFVPTEPGLNSLVCRTIEDDDGNPIICKSWGDIISAVNLLVRSEHEYKTVIIDTVDNAFKFCSAYVCKKRGIEHESDEEWGKGWAGVKKEFERIFQYLANSGIGLVFISHEKAREKEMDGIKMKYTDTTIPNQAKEFVHGLVDFIFYCHLDADHKRVMRTLQTMDCNAKDRTGKLPEIIPMDYPKFEKQLIEAIK